MGTPGPLELILIFAVVLLIFGAKRIPEIARGIGKGIREFKDATSEISKELDVDSSQQRRQINQPQAPEQGAPQPRQQSSQQQPEAAQPSKPASAESSTEEQEVSEQKPSEQKPS